MITVDSVKECKKKVAVGMLVKCSSKSKSIKSGQIISKFDHHFVVEGKLKGNKISESFKYEDLLLAEPVITIVGRSKNVQE